MNNQDILRVAMAQSAVDLCATTKDFEKSENVVVISRESDGARRYLKLPFYCAAWCNVKSVRNAIRSGFRPAWVQLTAKNVSFVEEMNRL